MKVKKSFKKLRALSVPGSLVATLLKTNQYVIVIILKSFSVRRLSNPQPGCEYLYNRDEIYKNMGTLPLISFGRTPPHPTEGDSNFAGF